MAFWGVELEPGKPYTHSYNNSLGRLRITQATLGDLRNSSGYVVVKCKVGNRSPVSLCSLDAGHHIESCILDIELEEKEDDVVFEVIGRTSVHLTGFYIGQNRQSGNGKVQNYGALPATQVANVKKEFDVEMAGKDPECKDTEVNGRRVRTMSSNLVIENLRTSGKPEVAYHGCYVEIRYFVQLKSTGYTFESNYTSPNRKGFRMGKGAVIKGLEDGINGMHVGDKRRLTIPPSLGYCGSKARGDVPADAWLVFEVELEYVSD